MRYLDLQKTIRTNIFSYSDVYKYFPNEIPQQIHTQLSRFISKGLLKQIKRGIYAFDENQIDQLELAYLLYQPSYISLETALHYYGVIPDIPQQITSITTTTTKKIIAQATVYSYTKIKASLFWGFKKVRSPKTSGYFQIAETEKALLDYFYIRKIKKTDDLRLKLDDINQKILDKYSVHYPMWVQKITI